MLLSGTKFYPTVPFCMFKQKLGITKGSGLIDGSWFFAKKPFWTINETAPSDWLNLKWFVSIAKAWISLHLLAVARVSKKAVLIVTWSLDALCRGSYGAFWRHFKTQDKSHLGVRDLCTGHCNLKDLINFDRTGLEPTVTSFEFKGIGYHGSISFDGTYLIFFLRKKVNKEIGYNCKRGRDWINLLSTTPIRVYNPFCIIDFLSRCLSWFWDKITGELKIQNSFTRRKILYLLSCP